MKSLYGKDGLDEPGWDKAMAPRAAAARCTAISHAAALVRRPAVLQLVGATDATVSLRCPACREVLEVPTAEAVAASAPLQLVPPAPTREEEVLAEAVRRIAQTVEVMARNGHYQLALPRGFAEDVARNATMAIADLLEGS